MKQGMRPGLDLLLAARMELLDAGPQCRGIGALRQVPLTCVNPVEKHHA